jgi:hypothetical protein
VLFVIIPAREFVQIFRHIRHRGEAADHPGEPPRR